MINKNFNEIHYPKLEPTITGPKRFDLVFCKFPKKDMWKLCINRKNHNMGQFAYEKKEPGYISGTLKGLKFIRKNINKIIDNSFINELHAICVKEVKYSNNTIISTDIGPIENQHIYYPFQISKCTALAKRELDSEKLIYIKSFCPNLKISFTEIHEIYCGFYNPQTKRIISKVGWQPIKLSFKERLKYSIEKRSEAIKAYNKEILKSTNDTNKLCAIAKLIRFLVILHCYTDGNLRTCKLLLIKLLIDNNFYPCILNDPHVLRGYLGVSELVKEIIEGVRFFIDSQKN